ncbi:hypothetical protein A2881_03225 [Candidatus Peribacteria bacterium RIFCSPHIGHO2_01_FULL_55_13]|nr:MAG: hypothetical protein A2881_03225 [Candidatus Peribacteria bacterium RIFCSPHIGHO2_01_FULL_55_13]OGJ64091.1 MAG: hypothetical protein A3F36_03630 [Candidatus Peribacteria bacterium RIFCSPHIGHO2_12_FULL_55_11]
MASRVDQMAQRYALKSGGPVRALQREFGSGYSPERIVGMDEEKGMAWLRLEVFRLMWIEKTEEWLSTGASSDERHAFAASLTEDQPDM